MFPAQHGNARNQGVYDVPPSQVDLRTQGVYDIPPSSQGVREHFSNQSMFTTMKGHIIHTQSNKIELRKW